MKMNRTKENNKKEMAVDFIAAAICAGSTLLCFLVCGATWSGFASGAITCMFFAMGMDAYTKSKKCKAAIDTDNDTCVNAD